MSSLSAARPESQDTISNPLSHVQSVSLPTSPQPKELRLKQEDTTSIQGSGAHLRPDITDNEDNQNEDEAEDSEDLESVAHGDDEDHSDQDHDDQEENEQKGEANTSNDNNNSTGTGANGNDIEGDLSPLSSDNDDDEEATSLHPNDEDAMAKHLKCQHGDVPERFTGRKSRGRYTMKDPAASSTLLPSTSFGAKKRRHHESSRSDAEMQSLSMRLNPAKLRKLGSGDGSDHRHYNRKFADSMILHRLDSSKRSGRHHNGTLKGGDISSQEDGEDNEDDDAEDSDFAVDNGQTPRQRYGILKAKFRYIYNERESLESEYEDMKKKLTRLRVERELLLDALLTSEQEYQDPSLQDIDDSE
ncbi:hypothetical protein BGZ80_001492 [Entomortierella chlamydospora]|uniref:Uncharacterized protein n=1 Tax=Entomortierella chlamydospora TaxID=101097 RepID=A0A9P6N1Q1_9FUNG|nr:hypothetical protein BGZ80_001492 [Entomortierella chlamydospora]